MLETELPSRRLAERMREPSPAARQGLSTMTIRIRQHRVVDQQRWLLCANEPASVSVAAALGLTRSFLYFHQWRSRARLLVAEKRKTVSC